MYWSTITYFTHESLPKWLLHRDLGDFQSVSFLRSPTRPPSLSSQVDPVSTFVPCKAPFRHTAPRSSVRSCGVLPGRRGLGREPGRSKTRDT